MPIMRPIGIITQFHLLIVEFLVALKLSPQMPPQLVIITAALFDTTAQSHFASPSQTIKAHQDPNWLLSRLLRSLSLFKAIIIRLHVQNCLR